MEDGAQVFTQVSRFLDEGDLLRRYAQIELSGEGGEDEVDIEDIIGSRRRIDKEFLRRMKEYFDQDDFES
jgi:hypothetical protein